MGEREQGGRKDRNRNKKGGRKEGGREKEGGVGRKKRGGTYKKEERHKIHMRGRWSGRPVQHNLPLAQIHHIISPLVPAYSATALGCLRMEVEQPSLVIVCVCVCVCVCV